MQLTRKLLPFILTCSTFLTINLSFGGSDDMLKWSCKNFLELDDREVLRLHAGKDPDASMGEVVFDGQITLALYSIQGLEHNWLWPVPDNFDELIPENFDPQFWLRLRPDGITHYFDLSMPEDEDGMSTATLTFVCERSERPESPTQSKTEGMPQRIDEHSEVAVTLQCLDLMMPECPSTHMSASRECRTKGFNGAVLKEVRQPGNLHDFECVK